VDGMKNYHCMEESRFKGRDPSPTLSDLASGKDGTAAYNRRCRCCIQLVCLHAASRILRSVLPVLLPYLRLRRLWTSNIALRYRKRRPAMRRCNPDVQRKRALCIKVMWKGN